MIENQEETILKLNEEIKSLKIQLDAAFKMYQDNLKQLPIFKQKYYIIKDEADELRKNYKIQEKLIIQLQKQENAFVKNTEKLEKKIKKLSKKSK